MDDRAAFDFIAENIDFARQDSGKGPLAGRDVSPAWKAVVTDAQNPPAVQRLMDVFSIHQLSSERHVSGERPTQSVGGDGDTDYFRRILQERLLPGDVRDQVVLADVERWKANRSAEMFASLFYATDANGR
jgi:hypothetical protein